MLGFRGSLAFLATTSRPIATAVAAKLRDLFLDPVNKPQATFSTPTLLFIVALWKVEAAVTSTIQRLLWPFRAVDNREEVLHFQRCTGMGDNIAFAAIDVYLAQKLGYKKLLVDWRDLDGFYLVKDPAQKEPRDLFELLFDVVPGTERPEILTRSQIDPAKHRLVVGWNNWPDHATATFGLKLWPPQCRPQILLLGRFEADFTDNTRDDWWDAQEMPPPHPFRFSLPVNRGCMRRILRDQQGWLDCIRLKPKFQAQLDAFVRERLDGTPTIGVHVRHGNGEKGHFARYNRGDRWANMDAAVDEVHADVLAHAAGLARPVQVLLMSDSPDFIGMYLKRHNGPDCRVITREPAFRPPPGQGVFMQESWGLSFDQQVQLAADAVIDMYCLGHCQTFLAAAHSNFTYVPAKLGEPKGYVSRQLGKHRREDQHDFSPLALCEFN